MSNRNTVCNATDLRFTRPVTSFKPFVNLPAYLEKLKKPDLRVLFSWDKFHVLHQRMVLDLGERISEGTRGAIQSQFDGCY